MKKGIKILFFSMVIVLLINGCDSKGDDIFQFKDSFVGDASAVRNITDSLHSAEHMENLELKTAEEPHGVVINYTWEESEDRYQETVIYNATFLFTLVQNVEWITFNFNNHSYTITRDNMDNWYGIELNQIQNEDDLKNLIHRYLEDENKVDELFN